MVAAVRIDANDDGVKQILREHPEIEGFIQRVTEMSDSFFPGGQVRLEPGHYEDDTPLMLLIRVDDPEYDFFKVMMDFGSWLGKQPDYDFDLISVAPLPYWNSSVRGQ